MAIRLTTALTTPTLVGPATPEGTGHGGSYGLRITTLLPNVVLASATVCATATGTYAFQVYSIVGTTWTKIKDLSYALTANVDTAVTIDCTLPGIGNYWIGADAAFGSGLAAKRNAYAGFPAAVQNVMSVTTSTIYGGDTAVANWYYMYNLKVQWTQSAASGSAVFGPYDLSDAAIYDDSRVDLTCALPDTATIAVSTALTEDTDPPASYDALMSYTSTDAATGGTASADSVYSTDVAANAFDGNFNTLWRSDVTTAYHWLKYDFGAGVTKTIRRLFAMSKNSSGMSLLDDYTFAGSNDNSNWTTLASGGVTNLYTEPLDINFDNETAYRYYRFYFSGTSVADNRAIISEFCLFETKKPEHAVLSYFEQGDSLVGKYLWVKLELGLTNVLFPSKVYALEAFVMSPVDIKKIKLILTAVGRMKYPQGDVTIDFTGSLLGPFNAAVAPFTEAFTPANITPVFNPDDAEHINLGVSVVPSRILIYYENYQADIEHLSLAASATGIRYHINDIPQ